jgi:hypothetical protein
MRKLLWGWAVSWWRASLVPKLQAFDCLLGGFAAAVSRRLEQWLWEFADSRFGKSDHYLYTRDCCWTLTRPSKPPHIKTGGTFVRMPPVWLHLLRLSERGTVYHSFSFFWLLLGRRVLRYDYIEYTAKRYAANVRQCIKAGYQPSDWNETQASHWESQLLCGARRTRGDPQRVLGSCGELHRQEMPRPPSALHLFVLRAGHQPTTPARR